MYLVAALKIIGFNDNQGINVNWFYILISGKDYANGFHDLIKDLKKICDKPLYTD